VRFRVASANGVLTSGASVPSTVGYFGEQVRTGLSGSLYAAVYIRMLLRPPTRNSVIPKVFFLNFDPVSWFWLQDSYISFPVSLNSKRGEKGSNFCCPAYGKENKHIAMKKQQKS
jgi:hypothetical protein